MIDATSVEERVKVLPPLSPGASRLLGVMGRRDHDIAEVVQAIECDSALTASVLRFINSASFALCREVTTVKEAVAYLGDTKVISVAMAASGGDLFNAELRGYLGTRGSLGRHCLLTAMIARQLARFTRGRVDPGIAFTSGLLHDLGKAIISDYLQGEAEEILAGLKQDEIPDFLAGERDVLGVDHCEVGSQIANHWSLPFSLRVGMKFHHYPAEAIGDEKPIAYVVHLADMLAMRAGCGTGADTLHYALDRSYQEFVKIQHAELPQIMSDLEVEFQAVSAALFGEAEEAG